MQPRAARNILAQYGAQNALRHGASDAYKVAIHTFHSFGSDVISQNRDYFYQGALFQPADEISIYEILRGIFKTLPLSDPLSMIRSLVG